MTIWYFRAWSTFPPSDRVWNSLYESRTDSSVTENLRQVRASLCFRRSPPGYSLMSLDTDVTLEDIARLCDVFYIGGTKVGALFGEAVVFTKRMLPDGLLP